MPDSEVGDSKIEGHGAGWKKLKENCLTLWGKTRDLRAAVYLVIAETAMGGFKDCGAALKVLRFLIRDMWETMYPKLDPGGLLGRGRTGTFHIQPLLRQGW